MTFSWHGGYIFGCNQRGRFIRDGRSGYPAPGCSTALRSWKRLSTVFPTGPARVRVCANPRALRAATSVSRRDQPEHTDLRDLTPIVHLISWGPAMTRKTCARKICSDVNWSASPSAAERNRAQHEAVVSAKIWSRNSRGRCRLDSRSHSSLNADVDAQWAARTLLACRSICYIERTI